MSVTEKEMVIADDDLIISSGETSSCLLIQNGNYVTVESCGELTDSILKDDGTMLVVEEGGIVRDILSTEKGWLYLCGSGYDLTTEDSAQITIFIGATLDKGLIRNKATGNVFSTGLITGVTVTNAKLLVDGGTAKNTTVQEDGEFVIQTVQV